MAGAALNRLQIVATVLPLAFIAILFVAMSTLGLPVWADVLFGTAIAAPFVLGFAFIVFRVVGSVQRELVRRETRFSELLESAPDAIIIVATDGKVVIVNEQATRIFGYAREELIGQPVERLVPEGLRPAHEGHRAGYDAHPERRPMGVGLELTGRRKDGSVFPVEISLSPIPSEEGVMVTSVIRDVTERRQLEDERNRLAAEQEMERERQRIGMDLHDGVIQSIYAVGLNLEAAADDVQSQPDEVRGRLNRAIDQLNDTIANIRSYIFDLRPTGFEGDLGESLRGLVNEFRVNSLVEVRLNLPDEAPHLSAEAQSGVFHIAQEALSNVRKHARANSASVILDEHEGRVRLRVQDNGAGFESGTEFSEDHRGLRNMASRARAAGGTLSVESGARSGTCVTFEVPAAVPAGESR